MNQFNVIVVPGSPALVAELAPQDTPGHAMVCAVRDLVAQDARPIHIVGSRDARWRTELTGSFAAWGAPQVTVGGGNFLAELVARYCLGDAEAGVEASRVALAPLDPDALTVVVLDGSAGLTPRAPLALIDGANRAHEQMADFLAGRGDLPGSLEEHGVVEPELWHELASLRPSRCELVAQDASLGVGRFVAVWQVDHA
ncbi:hypothetical protein [Corynebacterium urinipleomorphum]|uniref:hypothetical protein n=1 Tax=Corynebacterium urinipleomorphum TaxID=1852380 RepID=UPI000B35153C|nr:hypothetical protein [Corynebacterium urinipleomorphum]